MGSWTRDEAFHQARTDVQLPVLPITQKSIGIRDSKRQNQSESEARQPGRETKK